MDIEPLEQYNHIRSGGAGFYEQKRGLIAVWGKEAVQFLDGLITNDVKTLDDGAQMLAAFPNAHGRLLAVVRVLRQGDRFLFETEETTREKVFQNLFRFTFAGDFFVEDLSGLYRYFEMFGGDAAPSLMNGPLTSESEPGAIATGFFSAIAKNPVATAQGSDPELKSFLFRSPVSRDVFIPNDSTEGFRAERAASSLEISDDLHETLRIESGAPKYGVDMDETTIVPELGLDGLISYNKGCYIGQEIIARIHFRGHVAKRLTGLVLSSPPYEGGVAEGRGSSLLSEPGAIATGFLANDELITTEGKNAGRVTSVTFSPKLQRTIALAFVRYNYLDGVTELLAGDGKVHLHNLPFISSTEKRIQSNPS